MAMAGQQLAGIKPFDGTNYSNWEYRVRLLLEQAGVLEAITEEVPKDDKSRKDFLTQDVKARSLITQCLADNMLDLAKKETTAKGMWKSFNNSYSKIGTVAQVQLQRKLRNLEFSGVTPLRDFLLEFEQTVSCLKSAGGKMDDQEVVTTLLAAMPESYDAVTTAIDVLFCENKEQVTLEFCKNKLLMEESRKLSRRNRVGKIQDVGHAGDDQQAFYGGDRNRNFHPSNRRGQKRVHRTRESQPNANNLSAAKKPFRFACHFCGEIGHKRAQCPKRGRVHVTEEEEDVTFLTSVDNIAEGYAVVTRNSSDAINNGRIRFVIDSGATCHIISRNFCDYLMNPESVNYTIKVAKVGASLVSVRKGDLSAKTLLNRNVNIRDVLECDSVSHNLLSVKRLEENGCNVLFRNGTVEIVKSGKVIAEGKLDGNLYVLELMLTQPPDTCQECSCFSRVAS
uniref:Copia protein n=1 Tax=Lygus hesperus TaxID=30085 RepID=A0A0A9XL71_LYGHE